jgi:hypothetical protein
MMRTGRFSTLTLCMDFSLVTALKQNLGSHAFDGYLELEAVMRHNDGTRTDTN